MHRFYQKLEDTWNSRRQKVRFAFCGPTNIRHGHLTPGIVRPRIEVYYTEWGFNIPRFKRLDGPYRSWVSSYFGVCFCGVEGDGHYRLSAARLGYSVTCRWCTLPVRDAITCWPLKQWRILIRRSVLEEGDTV